MPFNNPYINTAGQFGAYNPSTVAQYPGQQVAPAYQGQFGQTAQQSIHGFIYVTGLDGAKAYPMPPNSEVPLFDSTDDVIYLKTTDGAGFPTITICDVYKRGDASGDSGEYVTRDELDRTYRDLAGQLEQVRGEINELVPTSAAAAAGTEQSTADKAGNGRRSTRRSKAGASEQQ